jgi:hypothetical protein
VDVLGPHPNLVVPRPKVKLGKNMCTMEFVKKVLNDRNRKLIFDSLPIEFSKIYTESLGAIFLVDEYNWRCIITLKEHVPPCVVLIINDNPYGLTFAFSYIYRTYP